MARREELLISRSRTLRSRRALAASSFIWSSLLCPGLDFGVLESVAVTGVGAPCVAFLMLSGSSATVLLDGSMRTEALGPDVLTLCFGRGLGTIELTLKAFTCPSRAFTGVLTLGRLAESS